MSSVSSVSDISSVIEESQKDQHNFNEESRSKGPLIIELENGLFIAKRRFPRNWYQIPELWIYFGIFMFIIISCMVMVWHMVQRGLVKRH